MDRRQRKTRAAIFAAFIQLLSQTSYDRITVGQIIEKADVGRATFYAHFETKEFLLEALCRELFAHVFEASTGDRNAHSHVFDCCSGGTPFVHLLEHLQNNDNHILDLLSGQNNGLFLEAFRKELRALALSQTALFESRRAPELPEDYWIDHIVSTFVQTVRWWTANGMTQTPEQVERYFRLAV